MTLANFSYGSHRTVLTLPESSCPILWVNDANVLHQTSSGIVETYAWIGPMAGGVEESKYGMRALESRGIDSTQ